MKICLVNNLYKPYNYGGAEAIVETIAKKLKKRGHEIFIISTKPITTPKKTIDNFKIYRIRAFNISSYYHLKHVPKIFRIFWHFFDLFDFISALRVKTILKKEKPEVVITNNLKGLGFLIPGVIKKLNLKHIHILHDIQLIHPSGLMFCSKEKAIDSFLAKLYISINNKLFNSPNLIISPSKWLLDLHIKKNFFSNSRKEIIPNPIELDTLKLGEKISFTGDTKPADHDIYQASNFSKGDSSRGKKENKKSNIFRILFVGQIEKHKGIISLINSYLIFTSTYKIKDSELIIIGTGKLIAKAKKQAKLNKNIKFYGRLEKDGCLNLMGKSSCLIVPSLCYENSPTVIYEAASVGLPVIASRLGGITELIKYLGGMLFNPANEGDLIYQLKQAYDNPEKMKKIGEKSRQKIKKYKTDNYIEKLEKIIDAL
jgi:glycosyltransferase involved in cell wall biosynthesis